MRLWHQNLIKKLPRQQLLGQHRECCALRGAGWGKNHSVVNYVFKHRPEHLVAYHFIVMNEMVNRGYQPDPIWKDVNWRGKTLGKQENWCDENYTAELVCAAEDGGILYPEHNNVYKQECLDNLHSKGVDI